MNHHSSTSISCICLGAFFLFLSWWMSSNLVCSKHEQRRKRLLRFHCWLERAGGVFQVYRDNLPALGWRAWKLKTPRVSRVARCQQMQPGLFSLEKNIKITQIFNWFWVWFRCFAKCFILFYFFPGRVDLYIYINTHTYIYQSYIKVDSSLSSSQAPRYQRCASSGQIDEAENQDAGLRCHLGWGCNIQNEGNLPFLPYSWKWKNGSLQY